MIKRKQRDKTVISLNDKKIKYLTLSKNNYGFYVKRHDYSSLEVGVIEKGEVLKIEFLSKIIKEISRKINVKSIDLILPHEYFLFELHSIKKEKGKSNKKILKNYLKKNKENISWARTHSYEYDLFEREKTIDVLFRAIPIAINSSYQELFGKSGIKINTIQSEIVSFSNLLYDKGNFNQIFIGDDYTYILKYKDGIFVSDSKFDLSYKLLIKDIIKNINVSKKEAINILYKYGVLRTHKDENVLKSLKRDMDPIIKYLSLDIIEDKQRYKNYIHFSGIPILGFSDTLRKVLGLDIYDLCVLCSSKYTFQDVLTIHKNDSYEYEALISRALTFFK